MNKRMRLPNFFNQLSGSENFSKAYSIDKDYENFKFPISMGIYIIALKEEIIFYPKADNNIIYIGMSTSDMSQRLQYHVEMNDNYGLKSYLDYNECIYYFCESKRDIITLEKEL